MIVEPPLKLGARPESSESSGSGHRSPGFDDDRFGRTLTDVITADRDDVPAARDRRSEPSSERRPTRSTDRRSERGEAAGDDHRTPADDQTGSRSAVSSREATGDRIPQEGDDTARSDQRIATDATADDSAPSVAATLKGVGEKAQQDESTLNGSPTDESVDQVGTGERVDPPTVSQSPTLPIEAASAAGGQLRGPGDDLHADPMTADPTTTDPTTTEPLGTEPRSATPETTLLAGPTTTESEVATAGAPASAAPGKHDTAAESGAQGSVDGPSPDHTAATVTANQSAEIIRAEGDRATALEAPVGPENAPGAAPAKSPDFVTVTTATAAAAPTPVNTTTASGSETATAVGTVTVGATGGDQELKTDNHPDRADQSVAEDSPTPSNDVTSVGDDLVDGGKAEPSLVTTGDGPTTEPAPIGLSRTLTATPEGVSGPSISHEAAAAATAPPAGQEMVELQTAGLAERLRPAFAAVRRSLAGLDELRLRIQDDNAGPIKVDIATVDNRIRVVLSAGNDDLMRQLGQERDRLADELRRAGFEQASIDIAAENQDRRRARYEEANTIDGGSHGSTGDVDATAGSGELDRVGGRRARQTTGLDLDL